VFSEIEQKARDEAALEKKHDVFAIIYDAAYRPISKCVADKMRVCHTEEKDRQ